MIDDTILNIPGIPKALFTDTHVPQHSLRTMHMHTCMYMYAERIHIATGNVTHVIASTNLTFECSRILSVFTRTPQWRGRCLFDVPLWQMHTIVS